MSAFSDSYVLRVLLATPTPVGLDPAARRWRRLRTSLFDPYRPRATLYARPWPEMARKARARRWALEPAPMKIRHISSAAANDHQAPAAHIADRSFVERATTVLLLGILWSGLAACILGALSYDIAHWFEGS
jgi:hypothetical protein